MSETAQIAAWMRMEGAPEPFVKKFEETGVMDGTLWPIRWPIQINGRAVGKETP